MKKLYSIILIIFCISLYACKGPYIDVETKEVTIFVGDTYEIQYKTNLDTVLFSSLDKKIATVNSSGVITGVGVGVTKVRLISGTLGIDVIVHVVDDNGNGEIVTDEGTIAVHFIDVGQADAIFLDLPNGEEMMIDAGYGYSNKETVKNNLFTYLDNVVDGKIEHFLITHNHQDHYGFVPDIIERYGVEQFYGNGSVRNNSQYYAIMQSIKNAGITYYVLEVGDLIIDLPYLKIQVVATQKVDDDTDSNITSVMVKLSYHNISFMFTGDGGYKNSKDAEYIALKSGINLKADVLKIGHHGSRYSTSDAFLKAVSPTIAVFTTVVNSQDGLPTQEVINKITKIGAAIYQTKDHGNIVITSDGDKLEVATSK